MSRTLDIPDIAPWQQQGDEYSFNCVGCPHLLDISMDSNHEVTIECDALDNK